jgi:succinate dehydrogenase / fumarate reductase cytochrome b subunit
MLDQTKRPIFLNLLLIRFPVPAIMSIAHRISGFLLVLLLPPLVFLLQLSLAGEAEYRTVADWLLSISGRAALFLFAWGLLHHFLAGLRYLLLDVDIGVDRPVYRHSAWLVLVAAPLLSLLILWRVV